MFPKQSSKNRHVRGPEMHGAHNPEAQIINKSFDKTKEKICFELSSRVCRASIEVKSAGHRHGERNFLIAGCPEAPEPSNFAIDRRQRRWTAASGVLWAAAGPGIIRAAGLARLLQSG